MLHVTCSISKCEKVKFTLFPIGALIFQVQFLNRDNFSLHPILSIFVISFPQIDCLRFSFNSLTPVVRIKSGEVWTLNDAGKPGHFCVAESAVSKLEPSSRHAEVRSEPDPCSEVELKKD